MPSDAAMQAARELIKEMRLQMQDILGGAATFSSPLSVIDIADMFDNFARKHRRRFLYSTSPGYKRLPFPLGCAIIWYETKGVNEVGRMVRRSGTSVADHLRRAGIKMRPLGGSRNSKARLRRDR